MEDAYGEEDGWRRTAAIVCPVHVEASASALQLGEDSDSGMEVPIRASSLVQPVFRQETQGTWAGPTRPAPMMSAAV